MGGASGRVSLSDRPGGQRPGAGPEGAAESRCGEQETRPHLRARAMHSNQASPLVQVFGLFILK